jgi:DNA-binding transcriptional LysR family regulator
MKVIRMTRAETGPRPVRDSEADSPSCAAPQSLELRHLRYFVAVADAGTFTHAAERLFIAQPTLSQQIQRLEQIVGTPLLRRQRDGVRLTAAGTVLLDASRDVRSVADHAVSQTRQAAGIGRLGLRFVLSADLTDSLAVTTTSRLRSAAEAAGVALTWLETTLDADFSSIRQRRADAGLGWLPATPDALAAPLDAISLGEFEPDVWIPCSHPAARRGLTSLAELACLDVIYGPRRASPATYDRWLQVLRTADPRFEFTDPPFRQSLPMALAFAATADRPTRVLTGPSAIAGPPSGVTRLPRPTSTADMTRASIAGHPLTATAALVRHGDLSRPLQQILFDTADGAPASPGIPRTRHLRCRLRPGRDKTARPSQRTERRRPCGHHDRQLDASGPGYVPSLADADRRNRIKAKASGPWHHHRSESNRCRHRLLGREGSLAGPVAPGAGFWASRLTVRTPC